MKVIPGLFEESELEVLRNLPEVARARERGTVHFTANVPDAIKQRLDQTFDISLPSRLPFRFMTGDTPVHADVGARSFDNTYLMYVTDGEGVFEVGEESYPIVAGSGFVFSEGTQHGVTQTNGTSRLVLGPMSESGFPVGAAGINANGATDTVYIQQGDGTRYSINQGEWVELTYPIYITNTEPSTSILKVLFTTDLAVSSANGYIHINSNGIQIGDSSLKTDGTRPNITVDGVADYPGFVTNSGYSNISIYNLIIDAANESTLAGSCGWVGGAGYGVDGTGNYIIGCSSSGPISVGSGGIVGSGAGSVDGGSVADLTILGCFSTGVIGDTAGGIAGQYAGGYDGSITIIGCCSTGSIGNGGGGIVGQQAASYYGTCTIQKCYSMGVLYEAAGGIAGQYSGTSGTVAIQACFNSQGEGGVDSGSIFGLSAGGGTATITNCYTPGSVLYGTTTETVTTTNCYAAEGTWSDAAANAALADVSTVWVSTAADTNYFLRNFGYTPYSLVNIAQNAQINTYTQTLAAGGNSVANVLPVGSTEFILLSGGDASITIDTETGVISTTSSTPPGQYVLQLIGIVYPLFIQTTFNLLVPGEPTAGTGSLDTKGKMYNNTTYMTVQEGQRFVVERIERPNLRFNSFAEYNKYLLARASFHG